MKFNLKSLAVAAAFVAAGSANAALTLEAGGSVTDQGWTVSGLTGSGTLSFSSSLIGALNAAVILVEQVDPAALTVDGDLALDGYKSIAAAAPIQSLSGSFDGTTVSVSKVSTLGGAKQTSFADDFTTSGGFLEIKNLKVDLGAKMVYADLVGDNGLGTKTEVALWTIDNIIGDTSFAAKEGTITSVNELTGLRITDEAFGYFVQGLGILPGGLTVLRNITDYGSISSTITVTATQVTPQVPEPSTYAMMGLGLIGMGLVARRRAK